MKKTNLFKLLFMFSMIFVVLAGCSQTSSQDKVKKTSSAEKTVTIKDIHGDVKVPINPKRVVALDNRTFETLSDWNVKLEAVPKGLLPSSSKYLKNKEVKDIGDHREPNLEVIAEANPDLVIVGQRFSSYYEEIKKLVPGAAVIDLNFDISGKNSNPGLALQEGFKSSITQLGKVFDKNDEANKLVKNLDQSIESVKTAYNKKDSVMGVIVSGGKIGFSSPGNGRLWGPMFDLFSWTSPTAINNSTSNHKGDDISVESIAQSNPDWLFVLDRDAAIAEESVAAKDVIENSPVLKNTKAVQEGHVVYASKDTYLNESIQTYTKLFENISSKMK